MTTTWYRKLDVRLKNHLSQGNMTNKEIKLLLKLCREQGVKSFKMGSTPGSPVIDIEFTEHWKPQSKTKVITRDYGLQSPDEETKVPIPNIPDPIESDELTDEQLMFYSAGTGQGNQQ